MCLECSKPKTKKSNCKRFHGRIWARYFSFHWNIWLKPPDKVEIGELERDGKYFYLGSPRVGRPGGGVGCIVKHGIKATQKETMKTKTLEHMEIELQLSGKLVTFLLVYRPEP